MRVQSHRFQLLRYFLVTSLVGIGMVTALLLYIYRDRSQSQMLDHEGHAHADLATAFANVTWSQHRAFVLNSLNQAPASASAGLAALRSDVERTMHGLRIVKVKVFNTHGDCVFSTDATEIGQNESDDGGFLGALHGRTMSEITFRNGFDKFDGVTATRDLVSSYVALRSGDGQPVEGVMELYSDVTDLIDIQTRAQWELVGSTLGLLGLLYGFLFMVVRHADGILRMQDEQRSIGEARVRHQALHDLLTGLPNRASFTADLPTCLQEAAAAQTTLALMFVDLDRFKKVNDEFGHAAGDELLCVVSQRFQRCLGMHNRIYRMGGDEFTILVRDKASRESVAILAEQLRLCALKPVPWHGSTLEVGATIGIALYPADGASAESLLKNADAAMYQAKKAGRNQFAFFASA